MNLATWAIGLCLVAQIPQGPSRYEPRLEPRAAPAVKIEDDAANPREPRDAAPADTSLNPPGDELDDKFPAAPRERLDDRAEDRMQEQPPNQQAGSPRQRLRPPDILAQALTSSAPPDNGAKPLSLVTALSRTNDRQQQLRIARAYWRLATAQAEFNWTEDHHDKLANHTRAHANAPEALSALASAKAEMHDAEVNVAQAQQELADLVGSNPGEPLPVTLDRPHVGGYNTYYDEIFAQRTPPARIRPINRMLPIRRKAIDAHGDAILAADDALEATADEVQRTGQGLVAVLTALDQLKRERRLFVAAVRDYNWEIAEYLFAVAPLGTSDKTLVSKLILNSETAQQPASPRAGERTFVPTEPAAPTEAPPPRNEPTPARERTSQYQAPAEGATGDEGLYTGLAELEPPERVEKLSELLHWNRALPDDAAQPTALAECLRGVAPQTRRDLITAYWSAREHAARYQALREQLDQLAALSTMAISAHDKPGIAEATVRLQATRRAARAALVDAQAALLNAEFQLTQTAGRRLDQPWLLPETPPSSQHKLPDASNKPRPTARRAESVAARQTGLAHLADAVIQADAWRASLVDQVRQSPADSDRSALLDNLVWAVANQAHDTMAFLSGLTEYNQALTDYTLATLPATVSAEELARQLVVERAARKS
jgi:hypothetical protein